MHFLSFTYFLVESLQVSSHRSSLGPQAMILCWTHELIEPLMAIVIFRSCFCKCLQAIFFPFTGNGHIGPASTNDTKLRECASRFHSGTVYQNTKLLVLALHDLLG